jgi:uncharacterized protein YecT (DUF1311 family)
MVKIIQAVRACLAVGAFSCLSAVVTTAFGTDTRAGADDEPSFDCVTALTKDEIVICAALSHEDRSLANLFKEVIESLPADRRTALAADQRRWVGQRNAACGVSNDTDLKPAIWGRLVDCLREQYWTRRDYLWTARNGQPIGPPTLPTPKPSATPPEYEAVWSGAASNPERAMEKLRTFSIARARLYAEILEHALSSESDEDFKKFAERVLWETGSDDREEAEVRFILIPCALMQRFPRLLELTRGFHGGNRDNFTPRPDCDVDAAGLPASVDRFLDQVDPSIRNRIASFGCGTSRYSWYKLVHIAEVRMSIVPQTYLNPGLPTGNWIDVNWAPLTSVPLERWSYASLPNRLAFEKFARPDFLQARADLAAHYMQAFGMAAEDALTASHRALWDQVEDLASNPGDYYAFPVNPANQAILSGASMGEIISALDLEITPKADTWELEYFLSSPMEAAATQPDVIRMLAAKGHPAGDALMVAASYGDAAAIDALVDAGAEVSHATPDRSHDQILKAWQSIRNCASVPRPDDVNGAQTPLMIAAQFGRLSAIQRLLERGADKDAVDSRGYRAVDYLQLRNTEAAERFSASQTAAARLLLD